jgi:hypothetical protein
MIRGHLHALPTLDGDSILGCQMAKTVPVGAQGISEHMGVATVVRGASER